MDSVRLPRRTVLAAVPAAAAVALPATLVPGLLSIGTYFVNPPFEFMSDGRRIGVEVELMEDVARRLGLRARFVETEWEVMLQQMQQRRFDCIVGGITITPARQHILAWSTPYLTTTLSLLVDARARVSRISDLRGGTVGVQAATTDYDAAVRMQRTGEIGGVRVYPFADIAKAMTDLRAGRIAAVMKVRPVAAWFVRHTPGLRMLGQVPDDPQPLGIGFALQNTTLRSEVDAALRRMGADGTLARFRTAAEG